MKKMKREKKNSWVGKPSYGGYTMTPENIQKMLFKLAHIYTPPSLKTQDFLEEVVQESWVYILDHGILDRVDPNRPLSPFLTPIVKGAIRKVAKSQSTGAFSIDAWAEDEEKSEESPVLISENTHKEKQIWLATKIEKVLKEAEEKGDIEVVALAKELMGEDTEMFIPAKRKKKAMKRLRALLEAAGI